LFGQPAASTQPSQPAASSSLFGALNNANASTQPAQQTVPAVKIDWTNVKPTTRFNELHQEVQDAIVFIDEIVQGSMKASMQCSEAIPGLGRQIESLPADVEYLDRRLETVEGALGRDAVAVGQNKEIIEKDSEDAVRLFRAIENLKLPNQFHYSTISSSGFPTNTYSSDADATDLLSYFNIIANELEAKSRLFDNHQREVDMHLRTVEHSTVEGLQKLGRRNGSVNGDATGEGLREVAGVMRTFEEAILRVAERVGEGREKVVDLSLGSGVR
jgi:nucleoporin p58/p45